MENYDIRLDRSGLYVVFCLSYTVAEFDTYKEAVEFVADALKAKVAA